MNEPFLYCEMSKVTYRKNELTVPYLYYKDEKGEEYTTTETDEITYHLLQNAYREKYMIPFPDEITAIRKRYGLSAIKMARLLGFGDNQYRLYEDGEMPSLSNAKMISGASDINTFKRLIDEAGDALSEKEKAKLIKRVEEIQIEEAKKDRLEELIFRNHPKTKSHFNGYVSLDIEKLRHFILFFAEQLQGVFETKLNKLLFYADFSHYKLYAQGISGLRYRAITYGPVPINYGTIYESLSGLHKDVVETSNGFIGSIIYADSSFNPSLFTEEELEIMQLVLNKFKHTSAVKISNESHKEKAWLDNEGNHSIIDYSYAFQINHILTE